MASFSLRSEHSPVIPTVSTLITASLSPLNPTLDNAHRILVVGTCEDLRPLQEIKYLRRDVFYTGILLYPIGEQTPIDLVRNQSTPNIFLKENLSLTPQWNTGLVLAMLVQRTRLISLCL